MISVMKEMCIAYVEREITNTSTIIFLFRRDTGSASDVSLSFNFRERANLFVSRTNALDLYLFIFYFLFFTPVIYLWFI